MTNKAGNLSVGKSFESKKTAGNIIMGIFARSLDHAADLTAAARWPQVEKWLLPGIFTLALAIKLVMVWQLSANPTFAHPIGDSRAFYRQAQEILDTGSWLGATVPFQSPFYPVVMAAIFKIAGEAFWLLGVWQAILGAMSCLFIYRLAQQMKVRTWIPLVAALLAVGYGMLTFFDGQWLGVSWTIFFITGSAWLLLKSQITGNRRWLLVSGVGLGLAVVATTQTLVLALPFFWLVVQPRLAAKSRWDWKPALFWGFGLLLPILPVTWHNYVVAHDLVVVSANSGVNFYLGNHPGADGSFSFNPDSGLNNPHLEESSVLTAEKKLGRKLKPSEVSAYWFSTGLDFIRVQPLAAMKLYALKLKLLLSPVEVPNQISFNFARSYLAPVLWLLPVNWGWIFPWALLGMFGMFLVRPTRVEWFYLLNVLFLVAVVLLFFILDRYRMPLVPWLICFAVKALDLALDAVRDRRWGMLALGLTMGLTVQVLTALDLQRDTFSHSRLAMIDAYLARLADKTPEQQQADLFTALTLGKQVIEVDPWQRGGYFVMADLCRGMGCYSAARHYLERWAKQPNPEWAQRMEPAIKQLQAEYEKTGDLFPADKIPRSPYETAMELMAQGQPVESALALQRILRLDPYHVPAWRSLARMDFEQGRIREAIAINRRAIKHNYNVRILYDDLAGIYQKQGNLPAAKYWRELGERNQD